MKVKRPKFFVTKKITKFIAKTINTIRNNSDNFEVLRIGNIFSKEIGLQHMIC